MSYTTTPNYGLLKPNVNSDNDAWGDHWNQNADTLDATIHGIATQSAVTSFNTRTGAVTLQASDVTGLGFATTTANDAAYINASGDTMAGPLSLSGNAVSGLQAVPLQQLQAAIPGAGSATPNMDGVGGAGTSTLYARQDHTHPTDTSRYAASNPSGYQTAAQVTTALAPYAPLASPAFTGVPTTAATPAPGDSSTKLATTAFVSAAIAATPSGASVTIADTPPASPSPGNLWWNSAQTGLNIYYNDGNSSQWVVANNQNSLPDAASDGNIYGRQNAAWAQVAPAAALNNSGRNLIHNGLMNVAQRGLGTWTTNFAYTVDRWLINVGNDTVQFSQIPLGDPDRAAIGDEAAQYAVRNVFTGSATAGSYSILGQRIENVNRVSGKTVTLSVWARCLSGTLQLGGNVSLNFGSGGSGYLAGTWQWRSISTTWARYSWTFTVPSVAGKTIGSANFIDVNFGYSIQGMNVQAGTVDLFGAQLEIGSTATPLEKPDPADDLRRCQRFYQTGVVHSGGYGTAGITINSGALLPVTMRATPTLALTAPGPSYVNGSGGILAQPYASGFQFYFTATAAGGAYFDTGFTASADL